VWCPFRKYHPEVALLYSSLFSRANSLFFGKNSLFC
jgi:hypothetical protein